jgi:hypothetical protein
MESGSGNLIRIFAFRLLQIESENFVFSFSLCKNLIRKGVIAKTAFGPSPLPASRGIFQDICGFYFSLLCCQ